jgi:hypothetical protein
MDAQRLFRGRSLNQSWPQDRLSLLVPLMASLTAAVRPFEKHTLCFCGGSPRPTADDYPFPLIIFARMCTDKGAIQPMKLKLGAFRGVCDAKNVDISIPIQHSVPSGVCSARCASPWRLQSNLRLYSAGRDSGASGPSSAELAEIAGWRRLHQGA